MLQFFQPCTVSYAILCCWQSARNFLLCAALLYEIGPVMQQV